jgi:hypothetical protein
VRKNRAGVRSEWKAEDEALMRAYKHLAKRRQVIDLVNAFKSTGAKVFDGCGPVPLPVLAIAPSDARVCHVMLNEDGGAVFTDENGFKWSDNPRRTSRSIRLPADTYARHEWALLVKGRAQQTTVPLIPPALRPKFKLSSYHTLWEVEQWKREPPRDPMLLRHLGGALYVVLATWDLTDIERAVLLPSRL